MTNEEILLKWSEEDKGYIITSSKYPGLSAFGTSRKEALNEYLTVVEGFDEINNERNQEGE